MTTHTLGPHRRLCASSAPAPPARCKTHARTHARTLAGKMMTILFCPEQNNKKTLHHRTRSTAKNKHPEPARRHLRWAHISLGNRVRGALVVNIYIHVHHFLARAHSLARTPLLLRLFRLLAFWLRGREQRRDAGTGKFVRRREGFRRIL